MPQRLVRDLMRIRHGHVVPESVTLREVAERLIISDCDVMAVTDSQGKLSGVICESSVVRALLANPAENATIQSIVFRHAESIRLDSSLNAVLPLFRSSANTAIPVIDAVGCVCGLLMRRDVISSLLHRRVDIPETPGTIVESTTSDPATAQSTPPASVIRPPRTTAIHGEESRDSGSGISQKKPYFLRAPEARRVLWDGEDRL